MEEGESLLLMFLGLHSFCHNTTHTFSPKNSKVLACKQYVWGMFHCGRMKNGSANIVLTNEVGESMEDSRTEDWTLNLTGVAWVDFYK